MYPCRLTVLNTGGGLAASSRSSVVTARGLGRPSMLISLTAGDASVLQGTAVSARRPSPPPPHHLMADFLPSPLSVKHEPHYMPHVCVPSCLAAWSMLGWRGGLLRGVPASGHGCRLDGSSRGVPPCRDNHGMRHAVGTHQALLQLANIAVVLELLLAQIGQVLVQLLGVGAVPDERATSGNAAHSFVRCSGSSLSSITARVSAATAAMHHLSSPQ